MIDEVGSVGIILIEGIAVGQALVRTTKGIE